MFSHVLPRCLLLCVLLFAFGAWSQILLQSGDDPLLAEQGLFDAVIPVQDHSDAERQNAERQGLIIVFSKLSGRVVNPTRAGMAHAFDLAATAVQSAEYQQLQQPFHQNSEVVIVHYQPDQVAALANSLGLPIWPQPRPTPLLWLVIDDGSGPRLVSDQQTKAVQRVLNQAATRGVQFLLPRPAAAPRTALTNAIWTDKTAQVLETLGRENATVQVTGKLFRAQRGWIVQWTIINGGHVLASGSYADSDPRHAMAHIADETVDTLARQGGGLAANASAPPQKQSARMHISSLASGADYVRLAAQLESQPSIQAIVPISAHDQQLMLQLHLSGDVDRFQRLIDDSHGVLEQVTPTTAPLSTVSAPAADTDVKLEYRVK